MRKLIRLIRYDWPLHFVLLLTNWLPDNLPFIKFRGWCAHWFVGKCGSKLRLARNVAFYNPSKIFLGNNIYLAYGAWISARGKISIKDNVTVGPYCVMSSSNHSRINNSYSNGEAMIDPIEVGEGCWLGAHCVVTAGSKIGAGSVIGAGAVVVSDMPGMVLAAGVPAKVIKNFSED